jgi:NAD(P)-dependent dehydrogenase (short-subunit alcohol dehydrogenase family)
MEISGITVMLTGGARIGYDVAIALAKAGATNFLLTYYQSLSAAQRTAAALRDLGANVIMLRTDVRNEDSVNSTVNQAIAAYGKIDALINMASIYVARETLHLNQAQWQADIDANATSTFLCLNAVAPLMKRQGQGRIINFADWTVASNRVNYPRYAAYYAAKHAVQGLTEAFALEYAPEVLINSIAPGPILPPPDLTELDAAEIARTTPLQRWGGGEEIATAVKFLIQTNFVTGECLRVDGGRHLL